MTALRFAAIPLLLSASGADAFFNSNPFNAPAKAAVADVDVETGPAVIPSKIDPEKNPSWFDFLKYDGKPSFDVLAKTIEFANCRTYDEIRPFYDDDYVFRGSLFGPLTQAEVERTQRNFQLTDAYSDLETRPFGYTIDPDNPYRCYYMERWEGTNDGELKLGPITLPPTGNVVRCPTHVMSLNWTPEGKVIYVSLSPPLDRWEGNTGGNGAVVGLLEGGGVQGNGQIGDAFYRFQQRLGHAIGGLGRGWSVEEEIPDWWKSKARGADRNDM